MSGTIDKTPMEFIHGCYVGNLDDDTDALVIKVHRHLEDGTVIPALKIEKNLSRPFYITKPEYQNHEFKKEWEDLKRLQTYNVPNHMLAAELSKALTGKSSEGFKRRQSIAELCSSQYVYGADLHIETLIKKKYQDIFEKSGNKPTKTTSGMFDIETDMVTGNGNDPNIITVTHENKVYTAILERFFVVRQKDGSFKKGNLEEFKAFSKTTLVHHIDELLTMHVDKNKRSKLKLRVEQTPFEYFYFIGKTSLELIQWIFSMINKNKTDFLGIWNLDFDIPKILATIKAAGKTYEDVMCPPELPKKYRHVKYVKDDKETADIYKRWHWLHMTGYSQFIDSMCLYRILRTVKGMEISMSLDSILKSNDLGGKLTFKDDDPATEDLAGADWHRYMQKNEAYKYIVYNQFDCISMQLMEWKNDDLGSMFILGGISRLCKWTKQTRKVADALYFDALEEGMVTSSPGPKEIMLTKFDEMIPKVGGAVLRPERTNEIGLRIFSDKPDIVTYLHNYVSDVDFSGMYPACSIVANISKETKISTGLNIENFSQVATQGLYSLTVAIQENAVQIGSLYFGLPGYEKINKSFTEYLKNK